MITSPGFPKPYRNGIDCTWNIQLPVGQLIQFNFLHFDIQPGFNLGWTWSWRFTAQSSNTIKKYTNGSIPHQYLFDTNYFKLLTYGSQKISKIRVKSQLFSSAKQTRLPQIEIMSYFATQFVLIIIFCQFAVKYFSENGP